MRGPDGFAWTWLRNVLVRIDPRDAGVHVVGKVEPLGMPTFVGRDVCLSGTEQLRRICNVVPARRWTPSAPLPNIHPAANQYAF